MKNKKTAVILFNLGGPDKLESVQPFLFNLFNDKAIISLPQPFRFFLAKLISSRRVKKAQGIYSKIGGKSPLLDITLAQADKLEKELSFIGDFRVFVAMRYWKPFAKEIVEKVKNYNPQQIILLPLYPQFSSATSESSIKDFVENFLAKSSEAKPLIKVVCCYPDDSDFIKSHALLIKQAIDKFDKNNFSQLRFLFSAHGLPQKVIDQGDPYVFQVEKTTEKTVKKLSEILSIEEEKIDFRVCYQSKVGPLKWTSPSLDCEIRRAAVDKKIPVVVPISFVSDHSETLVELDIDYKEMASELGISDYIRVAALNIDSHFIQSLTKICREVAITDKKQREAVFSGIKAARICPKKMRLCFNPNDCEE
jgi:protoporphyrin/coproporphyrin ferrochelatase